MSCNSSPFVSVLHGGFLGGLKQRSNYGAGDHPSGPSVGDFDGDGKLDVAVANTASNSVTLFLR